MTTVKLFAAVLMLATSVAAFGQSTCDEIYRDRNKSRGAKERGVMVGAAIAADAISRSGWGGNAGYVAQTAVWTQGEIIRGEQEQTREAYRTCLEAEARRAEISNDAAVRITEANNNAAIRAAEIAAQAGGLVTAEASKGRIYAQVTPRYPGVSCSTLQADGTNKPVLPTPPGCR